VASLAATVLGFVPPTDAAPVPSITFTLTSIPAYMINAHYELQTGLGVEGLDWTTLAAGTVPADTSLVVPVTLADALRTVNQHFMVVLSQRVDIDHAFLGNALLGVEKTNLVAGANFTAVPVVNEVHIYHSAEAMAAATTCPSCQPEANPGHVLAPGGTAPTQATAVSVPSAAPPPLVAAQPATPPQVNVPRGDGPPPGNLPDDGRVSLPIPFLWGPGGTALGPVQPIVGPVLPQQGGGVPGAPSTCPVTGGCVSSASMSSQPVGSCSRGSSISPDGYIRDCVTKAYDFAVEAFRGWSNHEPGSRDDYLVHNGYQQTWDNGYRVQAGPFQLDNSTSRTYGGGNDVTWLRRGDCWDPTQPGDDPLSQCTGFGWATNWGQDAWRWEKHSYEQCGGAPESGNDGCWFADYEIVFETAWNGGNDQVTNNSQTGDQARPSAITSNAYGGDWARWNPDTDKERRLYTSAKFSSGAISDITFPESFGHATFYSTETDTTSDLQGNHMWFRGPASGNPWAGLWYDYDGNHQTWQWEYWSCQFNSQYIGAMSESDLYATDTRTACWDARQ
jgi:hypothetical protein